MRACVVDAGMSVGWDELWYCGREVMRMSVEFGRDGYEGARWETASTVYPYYRHSKGERRLRAQLLIWV